MAHKVTTVRWVEPVTLGDETLVDGFYRADVCCSHDGLFATAMFLWDGYDFSAPCPCGGMVRLPAGV